MPGKLDQRQQTTASRLQALRDPIRLRVWRVLIERKASIGELTSVLGLDRKHIGKVGYHTRYLVKLGMAEEIELRQEKGHVIPIYKAMEKALIHTEDWDQFLAESPELAQTYLAELGQMVVDHLLEAIRAGTWGEDGFWHVSSSPMVLDQEGLEKGIKLLDEVMSGPMVEIQREAAERREETGEDAIQVTSDLVLLKLPQPV